MTARDIFAGVVFAVLLALGAWIEIVDRAATMAGGGG
jgi:hypothetical protein